MTETYTKHSTIRCPHCEGFLYSAIYATYYRWYHIMKDKIACINCARMWRLVNGVMVVWPERNGDAVIEAELVKAELKSPRKRKKIPKW